MPKRRGLAAGRCGRLLQTFSPLGLAHRLSPHRLYSVDDLFPGWEEAEGEQGKLGRREAGERRNARWSTKIACPEPRVKRASPGWLPDSPVFTGTSGMPFFQPSVYAGFRPAYLQAQCLRAFPAYMPANASLTRVPALPCLKRPKDVGLRPVVAAGHCGRPARRAWRTQRFPRIFSSACRALRTASVFSAFSVCAAAFFNHSRALAESCATPQEINALRCRRRHMNVDEKCRSGRPAC